MAYKDNNIKVQAIINDDIQRDQVVECLKSSLSEESVRIEVKDLTESPGLNHLGPKIASHKIFIQRYKTKIIVILAVIFAFVVASFYYANSRVFDPILLSSFTLALVIIGVLFIQKVLSRTEIHSSGDDKDPNLDRKIYISVQCHRKLKNRVIQLLKEVEVETFSIN